METRPIDPVEIVLIDGKPRSFLLSMGGIRRLKQRLKCKTLPEIMSKDTDESIVPVLWEALLNKEGMTEEQLADLIPAHIQSLASAINDLFQISLADKDPNPQSPSPAVN
jgi:hypothetical protein